LGRRHNDCGFCVANFAANRFENTVPIYHRQSDVKD
jgi:hypothetical protein